MCQELEEHLLKRKHESYHDDNAYSSSHDLELSQSESDHGSLNDNDKQMSDEEPPSNFLKSDQEAHFPPALDDDSLTSQDPWSDISIGPNLVRGTFAEHCDTSITTSFTQDYLLASTASDDSDLKYDDDSNLEYEDDIFMESGENPPPLVLQARHKHYPDAKDMKELCYQFGLLEIMDKIRVPIYAYDEMTEFVQLCSLYGANLEKSPCPENV